MKPIHRAALAAALAAAIALPSAAHADGRWHDRGDDRGRHYDRHHAGQHYDGGKRHRWQRKGPHNAPYYAPGRRNDHGWGRHHRAPLSRYQIINHLLGQGYVRIHRLHFVRGEWRARAYHVRGFTTALRIDPYSGAVRRRR